MSKGIDTSATESDRETTTRPAEATGSQTLGTHWERFFRSREAGGMDAHDHTVDAPRGSTSREWEVFCRETESAPLEHVGSVTAPSQAVAREQATTLFGHAAAALWLCPADETVRLQDERLGVGRAPAKDEAPTMGQERMETEQRQGEPE